MKKRYFVLVLMAMNMGVSVYSQEENKKPSFFKDNTFVQAGIGLGMYGNSNADMRLISNTGFEWEMKAGKWITNAAALAVNLSGMGATSSADIRRNYMNMYFDFIWDPIASFTNTPEARVYTFNPYIGFGVSHVGKSKTDEAGRVVPADNDYTFHFGVQANYRFTPSISVYLNLLSLFTPPSFDGNEELGREQAAAMMEQFKASPGSQLNLSVGVKYDFGYEEHRRRLSTESVGLQQDWFFGATLGYNRLRYPKPIEGKLVHCNPQISRKDGANIFAPAINLHVGKAISPLWALRLSYEGFRSQIASNGFNFWNIHADVMINLNFIELGGQIQELLFQSFHYVPTPHEDRKFGASFWVGCGLYDNNIPTMAEDPTFVTHRDSHTYAGSANIGVIARYKVGKSSDVYANFSYCSIPPRMYGDQIHMKTLGTGFRSITVGYQYNVFGRVKRY